MVDHETSMGPRALTPALLFLLAILVAGALRLVALDQSPPGLFRDELEKGYTALQLWHTQRHGILGADGVRASSILPLFIEVFDGHDRTSAIYQYATAPFVGLGGLNYWTTRFAATLSGILGVLIIGGFAWRLIGPMAGVAAAMLLALHPTGVLFSRWAQQGIMQAMLMPAGFWLLYEAEKAPMKHRRALSILGAILLWKSAWAYDPGRLVVPLMAAAWLGWRLVGISRQEAMDKLRLLLPAIVLFLLLWIPLAVYTVGVGGSRLDRVGLGGDGFLATAQAATFNYFSFWTPAFWIIHGDNNPRHHLPGAGFAGPIVLLAMVGSLLVLLHGVYRKGWRWALATPASLFLAWVLVAPMAAALTREGNPHALRAILLVPASCLLGCALFDGVVRQWIGSRPIVVGALVALWLSGVALTGWGVWRLASGPGAPWEAGTVEAVRYGLGKNGTVWLSSEIPYAVYIALFAEETDPALFQEEGLAALKTRLLPPGEIPPALQPGDTWISPPRRGLPIQFHSSPVVIYERGAGGAFTRFPPGKEHLYERMGSLLE